MRDKKYERSIYYLIEILANKYVSMFELYLRYKRQTTIWRLYLPKYSSNKQTYLLALIPYQ